MPHICPWIAHGSTQCQENEHTTSVLGIQPLYITKRYNSHKTMCKEPESAITNHTSNYSRICNSSTLPQAATGFLAFLLPAPTEWSSEQFFWRSFPPELFKSESYCLGKIEARQSLHSTGAGLYQQQGTTSLLLHSCQSLFSSSSYVHDLAGC